MKITSKETRRSGYRIVCVLLALLILDAVIFYPYGTDPSLDRAAAKSESSAVFYNKAYENEHPLESGDSGQSVYVETARAAAEKWDIEQRIRSVMERYAVPGPRVLEVGSGSGLLQDVVSDYTGLDIAETAAGYYHKPFVAASADALPFPDNAFDAVWSVWVLEHISNPERALMEIRRVLKPGGILILYPGWNVSRWAAQGYEVRPYSDFDWAGKIVKATVPVLKRAESTARGPIRLCRRIHYAVKGDRVRLRFHSLHPNYNNFLVEDSDAAISLDSYEAKLWFQARGDDVLEETMVVRVRK